MVTTWALKGVLYHEFGTYVYTIVVLGPFGFAVSKEQGTLQLVAGLRTLFAIRITHITRKVRETRSSAVSPDTSSC